MSSLKYNIYIKLALIFLVWALLFIPIVMIQGLIYERENSQSTAIAEVNGKWGGQQTLYGPYLSIPYYSMTKEYDATKGTYKTSEIKEHLYILPNKLNISGNIKPEKRSRGIYEIVLYNSKLHLDGDFTQPDLNALGLQDKKLELNQAKLVLGINDLTGIENEIYLNWEGKKIPFNAGVPSNDVVQSGVNAEVNFRKDTGIVSNFSFDLDLKGSQQLYFTPVGKVTDIELNSVWNSPSFNGAFIPDDRTVSDKGFHAIWNVLHLNRNYPQAWTNNSQNIQESRFGVDLVLSVDNYQKCHRAIKYAILFTTFTFLIFFFIEILNNIFIHPIQYILVGIALIVFFILLLSISEHWRFNPAYIVSALATLCLIGGYISAVLKSRILTYFIVGLLSVLYLFIFVLIQLEDYALLIGSLGIFVILALVMYYSRKIDWYAIQRTGNNTTES